MVSGVNFSLYSLQQQPWWMMFLSFIIEYMAFMPLLPNSLGTTPWVGYTTKYLWRRIIEYDQISKQGCLQMHIVLKFHKYCHSRWCWMDALRTCTISRFPSIKAAKVFLRKVPLWGGKWNCIKMWHNKQGMITSETKNKGNLSIGLCFNFFPMCLETVGAGWLSQHCNEDRNILG